MFRASSVHLQEDTVV